MEARVVPPGAVGQAGAGAMRRDGGGGRAGGDPACGARFGGGCGERERSGAGAGGVEEEVLGGDGEA